MSTKRFFALFVALAMVGCGDDDGMIEVDGGPIGMDGDVMLPDSGPLPDGGPGMCSDGRAITLTAGTQQITGDTTDAPSTRVLGEGCGGEAVGQELLAFQIPGSGEVGVSFSLANDSTEFDTTVEVRPAGCDDVTDALCFDDISLFDPRSEGSFIAEGGETVYVIVTGYDAEALGPWAMDVNVVVNPTAPVLTSGTALRVDDVRVDLALVGTDADGDASYFAAAFLDESGNPIGLDLDEDPATPDDTEFFFDFSESVLGMTSFTAPARVGGLDDFPELAAATQIRIRLYDAFDLESDSMTFDLVDVTESGLEGPCVDGESICADAFVCTDAVCALPPAAVTACGGATALTLTPGTASVQTAAIAAGDGGIVASCGDTEGDEALYTVTVPAGAFDLVATTVRAANDVESVDTVVYVQTTCGDPYSEGETGCSDDVGDDETEDYRSTVELRDVAAGTYTVGVELWGGATEASTVELAITLRPVLPGGSACDPMGQANRCATGECVGAPGMCPVP
ncbi:MAG: hypothetical protein H6720_23005 [Sandaracinus sp.]|nr:hypothetical protein [Sandaracinus sp.]